MPDSPADAHVRLAVVDEAALIDAVLVQTFSEYEALYTPAAFAATTPTPTALRIWPMGEL